MNPGARFELECYNFLKRKYSNKHVFFVHRDTADSTGSDIEVIINQKLAFFIEAKGATAQSGQFVLFANEDNRTFEFSTKNQSDENEFTSFIIEYMNNDFDRFNAAGTAGEKLEIDSAIFVNWITDYYKKKKVKYVISKKNDYIIMPIDKFGEYFTVNAKYRIKKSGSGEPAKKSVESVISLIKDNYDIEKYYTQRVDGKNRLFVIGNPSLKDKKIDFDENTYALRERDSGLFEVRKLSNTRHKNVIFDISIKQEQQREDLEVFEKEIQYN